MKCKLRNASHISVRYFFTNLLTVDTSAYN